MNRAVRLAPLLFALAGSGVALCVGMLLNSAPPFRVPLDAGVPLLLIGALVGATVGARVSESCARRSERVRVAGMATVVFLMAAVAAPFGWVVGCILAELRPPPARLVAVLDQLPRLGMVAGSVAGCVTGLAAGAVQIRLDRHRASTSTPGEPGAI